jgi:hypothetical protein
MPVRTGDLQDGVSRAYCREGGEAGRRDQARNKLHRLEENLAAADITLSDDELGQLTDASLEGRSGRSLPRPPRSPDQPLTRGTQKTTMREVGSTTYDWTRLGPKIGRLALGCMSYGNPTTPSSKVATKEVLTTEN